MSFLVPAAAALAALGLAAWVVTRPALGTLRWALGLALAATGAIQLANLAVVATGPAFLVWRRLALLAELALAASLFWVGAAILGTSATGADPKARRRAAVVSGLCLAIAPLALSESVFFVARLRDGLVVSGLGRLGVAVYGFLVVALVLAMAQFEAILSAARDPLRYRLKFMLIGLGTVAVYEVLRASYLLLLRTWMPDDLIGAGIVGLLAVGFVGFGLGRQRLQDAVTGVYVSPRVVYGSLTFLAVGLYLVAVGLVGEVVRRWGWGSGVRLGELVTLLGFVLLVVAYLSRRLRVELVDAVSRHVYRSRYDYRAKWLEVTDAFQACESADEILDRLLELLARTFAAGRISIWLRYDADKRFHRVRSTNVESAPAPLAESHPLVRTLRDEDGPVAPDEVTEWRDRASDPFLEATHAALFVPIRGHGQLDAFVALGPDPRQAGYGTDVRNLLRAITHHAGVLLSQARQAEESRNAAELEALHRLSAFYVHDLKTLGARLSLVAQNAQVHETDPAFRDAAFRTVARTAKDLMGLVDRLARRRLEPSAEPVAVEDVIADATASVQGALRVAVRTPAGPLPRASFAREALRQVLLNLMQNAAEAQGTEVGEITVGASASGDGVAISVADRGPGIDASAMRTLFQPFRTSKDGGMGLGLYECKRIVEAHGGSIRVDSEPGRGTSVVIELRPWSEGAATEVRSGVGQGGR